MEDNTDIKIIKEIEKGEIRTLCCSGCGHKRLEFIQLEYPTFEDMMYVLYLKCLRCGLEQVWGLPSTALVNLEIPKKK